MVELSWSSNPRPRFKSRLCLGEVKLVTSIGCCEDKCREGIIDEGWNKNVGNK